MHLTDEIKNKIIAEYEGFKKDMYASKTLEQRRQLDAFYTPAGLTIQMIEKFDCEDLADKRILDPCCGSGNLLAACIIAGANPKNIYGNEFDPDIVKACKKRLNKLCRELGLNSVPTYNIHEGDALRRDSLTEFNKRYEDRYAADKQQRLLNASLTEENLW